MTQKTNHAPAQTSAPLDFLIRFQPNQRLLVRELYQSAAAQRQITKAISVQFYVIRQITLRAFRALGDSDGAAYEHSLMILRDHANEAQEYACAVLQVAGKGNGGKAGGRK